MAASLIEFDRVEQWEHSLRSSLAICVARAAVDAITHSDAEYVEDTRDLLFKLADRDAVINATLDWIRHSNVAMYHGTRLTAEEADAVQKVGLAPLVAKRRHERLSRALSHHPRWNAAQTRLQGVLQKLGSGYYAGHREGQVHFTLSRAGLTNGFNHYLTHGSEFDQHAAFELLGDEGVALLAQDGTRTLIRAVIEGDIALSACHPYLTIEDMRARGNVPNLVSEILKVWTYRLVHPDFDPRSLEVDCGFVFRETVSPVYIVD
jgi:hypothetical protein